ncbi:effector binding domain-containing protein [Lysinibacillus sp. FSL K6-0232]|uniref:effector binding domain-containing protein n=1 Tax=Lysinibacillus sp. FSL K6-0232 TaxID=2921425 RepID=UPI0030F4D5FE
MMQSYCQSCSMPLTTEALLGTEKGGSINKDYCRYCYQEGEFTQPTITIEEMVEICVPYLKDNGMAEKEARHMLVAVLPDLKRWRKNKSSEPKVVERPAFYIMGIAEETSNAQEITAQAKISQLWTDFYQQNIIGQIANRHNATIYGLYSDYATDVNGDYTITLGVEVSNTNEAPAGMVLKTIPAAKYAVFTSQTGTIPEIVIQTWQDIWAWFASAEVERTYTGDFEVYDERCTNPQKAQVDIYIAIK